MQGIMVNTLSFREDQIGFDTAEASWQYFFKFTV